MSRIAWLRTVTTLFVLGLGLFVALSPAVVYAPTPRVVLYLLLSFLPALLLGIEAKARFQMTLPGFLFTTSGAFAVCLGTLWMLTVFTKPDAQIAIYDIVDDRGQELPINWPGAVQLGIDPRTGLSVTKLIDHHTLILIFPEQVGEVRVRIRPSPRSEWYTGAVTYAGTIKGTLRLGRDLRAPN